MYRALVLLLSCLCAGATKRCKPHLLPVYTNDGVSDFEEALVSKFIADYHNQYEFIKNITIQHIYTRIQSDIASRLKFWIPPEITYRAKDPESMRVKLLRMSKIETFTSYNHIIRRLYDLIGVRFTTFMPSIDIPAIVNLFNITDGFEVLNFKGPSDDYGGTNVHICVDGYDVEVQLRGGFNHSFYQVNHKFGA